MSDEIRELTAEEKAVQEALDQKLAKCETEEEAYEIVMRELMPDTGSGELGEDDLDLVVGGMSRIQASSIVATAYWEMCVRKKKSCDYSAKQINEAMKICAKSTSAYALAVMILPLKALGL